MKRLMSIGIILAAAITVLAGCGSSNAAGNSPTTATLTLGAFSTPKAAYTKIFPLFQAYWKQQDNQTITFNTSYQGSGAQAKAIVNGFPADVAALSTSTDISTIQKAGLITHDWTSTPTKGIVSDSVVAFAVRSGNPKGIHDWADLAKPGIQILTPDARTSGGAQWNVLAAYGAALRGKVTGVAANDPAAAQKFLEAILKNVKTFDKDGQTSLTDFETGIGDVAITYEASVIADKRAGKSEDLVVPVSSLLIEEPVAVVDTYAQQHGVTKAAQAFVDFLFTAPAQQVFADYGLRSVNTQVAQATAADHLTVADQWDITFLGGWSSVETKYFGTSGIYTQALSAAQGA